MGFWLCQCIVQFVTYLILSRLDYCNGVLACLPSSSLHNLRKGRLVMNKSKCEHAKPLLAHLHRLLLQLRVDYELTSVFYYHCSLSVCMCVCLAVNKIPADRMLRFGCDFT